MVKNEWIKYIFKKQEGIIKKLSENEDELVDQSHSKSWVNQENELSLILGLSRLAIILIISDENVLFLWH